MKKETKNNPAKRMRLPAAVLPGRVKRTYARIATAIPCYAIHNKPPEDLRGLDIF